MANALNPLTDQERITHFKRKLKLAEELCSQAQGYAQRGDVEFAMQQVQSAERLLKESIEHFWLPIPDKKEVDAY